MKYETAGDPIGDLKWTRRTTRKIADALGKIDIYVSKNTVGRLLKSIDFRLRVNHKKRSTTSPPERDAQFRYIKKMRRTFVKRGDPVISIDCKKKELVGDFKNAGEAWRESAIEVLDHDFRTNAKGTAAPFGFYDQEANRGFVVVGKSRETPEFVVDCLRTWWRLEGRVRYPNSKHILILADCGGGNGVVAESGESAFKKDFATTIASRPPYVTIHREHQSGIRLNISFSTRLAKIGKGNHSKVMKEYLSLSAPLQLKPASKYGQC